MITATVVGAWLGIIHSGFKKSWRAGLLAIAASILFSWGITARIIHDSDPNYVCNVWCIKIIPGTKSD